MEFLPHILVYLLLLSIEGVFLCAALPVSAVPALPKTSNTTNSQPLSKPPAIPTNKTTASASHAAHRPTIDIAHSSGSISPQRGSTGHQINNSKVKNHASRIDTEKSKMETIKFNAGSVNSKTDTGKSGEVNHNPKEDTGKSKEDSGKPKEDTGKSKEDTGKSKEDTEKFKGDTDKSKEDSDKSKEDTGKSKEDTEKSKEDTEKSKEDTDKWSQIKSMERNKGFVNKEAKSGGNSKLDLDRSETDERKPDADKSSEGRRMADSLRDSAAKMPESGSNQLVRLSDSESSSHFVTLFVAAAILFGVLYVAYHNRLRLAALLLEGPPSTTSGRGSRRTSGSGYKRLPNDEELPPAPQQKPESVQNFIY